MWRRDLSPGSSSSSSVTTHPRSVTVTVNPLQEAPHATVTVRVTLTSCGDDHEAAMTLRATLTYFVGVSLVTLSWARWGNTT